MESLYVDDAVGLAVLPCWLLSATQSFVYFKQASVSGGSIMLYMPLKSKWRTNIPKVWGVPFIQYIFQRSPKDYCVLEGSTPSMCITTRGSAKSLMQILPKFSHLSHANINWTLGDALTVFPPETAVRLPWKSLVADNRRQMLHSAAPRHSCVESVNAKQEIGGGEKGTFFGRLKMQRKLKKT